MVWRVGLLSRRRSGAVAAISASVEAEKEVAAVTTDDTVVETCSYQGVPEENEAQVRTWARDTSAADAGAAVAVCSMNSAGSGGVGDDGEDKATGPSKRTQEQMPRPLPEQRHQLRNHIAAFKGWHGSSNSRVRVLAATLSATLVAAAMLSAIVLVLTASPGGAQTMSQQDPVELNPSVMVLGYFDWVPYQDAPPYTSRCTDMVDRGKRGVGGTRINYVPTHYWRDPNGDGSVDGYCFMDSDMNCIPMTEAAIRSFREGMELCFRRAIEEGLGISIVPHLDDGGKTAAWRNGLVFNPKQHYGGFSYQEVLLNPLIDSLAIALATKPSWIHPLPVWFALQGEMSATVLRFPREYMQLVDEMRERLLSGMWRAGASESYITAQRKLTQVGVSFNFNKITQINTGGGAGGGSAASVLSRFQGFGAFGAGAVGDVLTGGRRLQQQQQQQQRRQQQRQQQQRSSSGINLTALQVLFEKIDFLGISAYAALDDPSFPMTALQNAAFTFFGEMRDDVGLDVAVIIRRRRIDLHYSEFGMGGGASPIGTVPARSPEQAARMPFYGVWGAYRGGTDPWATSSMKNFLHSFFRKTLAWLAQGGGPTYSVSHCFLWGMGSWDALGIYPESTTPQGSYRDPDVVQAIQAHNTRTALSSLTMRATAFNGDSDGN